MENLPGLRCAGCGSGACGLAEMARIIQTIKGFVYDQGRQRRCGVSEIIGGEEAEEEAVFGRLEEPASGSLLSSTLRCRSASQPRTP
uniref:Uncharacterized protein n=1 Tax=Nelumbo nucifera TaxID=4432 RepID=A0A822XJ68_NELNU|nr:TPA_asm: hypothetical protein HUJ06_021770 [Nelumbo nucifera]